MARNDRFTNQVVFIVRKAIDLEPVGRLGKLEQIAEAVLRQTIGNSRLPW